MPLTNPLGIDDGSSGHSENSITYSEKSGKNSHDLMGEKKESKRNQGLLCIIIVRNVKTMKKKREMRNSFS